VLEPIGIGKDAEAVYRVMLAHRDWDIEHIVDHLGLSEDVVRAALEELESLSLLAPAESTELPVRPVDPMLGLTSLVAQAEAEIDLRRHELETARATMAMLAAASAEEVSSDGFVHLDGIDAIRQRLERLAVTVQFECLSMNPVEAQSMDAKHASKPLNQLLVERGVRVQCLYQQSFTSRPELVEYAEWLSSIGGEIRTVPVVPSLIVIYDRHGLLVPIDGFDTHVGAIEVTAPGIVKLAHSLFEQMWNSALPYGEHVRRDQAGLTPTERQLLRLLGDGHTDDVAARRLGVSLSTVRRLMARLMERLSARSRFQAGVRVAESGWLDSSASSVTKS
jgi:DNA-binding CsgD family transcriptional regulator